MKNRNTKVGAVLSLQMQGHALRTMASAFTPFRRLATLAIIGALMFIAPPAALAVGLAGMVLDERTEFCDATALNTGGAASYLLGDVIDLSVVRDIAQGKPIFLVIQVDTAVTSGGAGTYGFSLCSDAQAAIAVDGSQTTHFATAQIPKATLIAGYIIACVALPGESPAYEQFLGIVQTTAVAAATAGKINAFLTLDASKWKAYADAI